MSMNVKRFVAGLVLTALLALPAAALAQPDAPLGTSGTALAQAAGVTIIDFAFTPGVVSVPAGSTVSWFNGGAAPHTVTSNSGAFASDILSPGGSFSTTLWAPGSYGYFCQIHPGMVGSVEVS